MYKFLSDNSYGSSRRLVIYIYIYILITMHFMLYTFLIDNKL